MWSRRKVLGALATAAAGPGRAAGTVEAGKDIVLGQSAVLSGPLGVPIQSFNAGAALAFAQANAAGGINGRRLRLESMDDELKPDKAVANYRRMLDDGQVFAFFGCVGSGTTAAAAPLLRDSGAPLVGAYAVADSARRKALGAAYFVRAGTGREAQALAQHLGTMGISRMAMAHLDNPGGQEAAALLSQALQERKLELAVSLPVKNDGSNVADAGAQLAKAAPQAVIMYLAGELPARLMQATWAAGGNPSFYGMSIVPGEVVARALGQQMRGLVITQVMHYPWAAAEPAARDFRRLAGNARLDVGYVPLEGYVNALVMIEALRRCGNELTRPRLHAALRGMRQRIGGVDIDFTDAQALSGSRYVDLVHVGKDGRFVR